MHYSNLLLFLIALGAVANAQRWQHTTSGLPTGREAAVICYDPVRDRTILFGGADSSGQVFGDAWAYDGVGWTRMPSAVGPPPRHGHAMVYDTHRRAVVLFGGRDAAGGTLSDTWELTPIGWREIHTTTAPRGPAAMAYNANRQRTVLLTASGETWTLDSASGSWLQINAARSPGRALRTLTYDAGRDRVLAFGGEDCLFGSADVWEFDGGTWHRPASSGPVAPCHVVMTYDAPRGRTIAFGGFCRTGYCGGTWAYESATATWSVAAPPATSGSPLASYSNSITYDARRGVLVLVTARTFGASLDTWELQVTPVPHWSVYGAGCAGLHGSPRLRPTAGSRPALGTTFELQLSRAVPGAAVLLFGLDTATTTSTPLPVTLGPLLPGCRLWLDPAWSITLDRVERESRLHLAIPNLASLAGLRLAHQALCLDPSAPGGLGTMSNGGIAMLE